jgi:SAM-dependent methyltransferase
MSDDTDTRRTEAQVAWAFLQVRKPTATYDELRAAYQRVPQPDAIGDWTGVFAAFAERGYVHQEDETYSLTPAGEVFADMVRGEDFGEGLVRLDQSAAYGHFCALLFGRDLRQFSMTTMTQLDTLIRVLRLDADSRVLDLGCSVGRIAEYVSDVTGASVTGLDFAGPAIRRAQERTRDKAGRLTFVIGSMNRLDFPAASFDTILSLDTLYFATDLPRTLERLKILLRTGGQMGLFWSQRVPGGEDTEQLQPDKTRLAQALSELGMTFRTHDFSAEEKSFWRRTRTVLDDLKAEFEAEGNTRLYEERLAETRGELEAVESERVSRYLYHVRV